MEDNTTRSEEVNIYNITYPLYAIHLKMLLLLVAATLTVMSSLMVILAILKNKKLRKVDNLLIVNLLFTDLVYIFVDYSYTMYLASIFFFDLETNDFCNVYIPVVLMLSRATTLMVIPMAVYRVVSVSCPFSYKRIMTKKRIIAMMIVLWLFAVFAAVVFAFNYDLVFVPSLATCAVTYVYPITFLIFVVPEILSFALVLFVSAYLCYKIIKSNRFIHGLQRNASDREKVVRAGRLVGALKEQIKPTLSVLITGGIDGLFDLLVITIAVVMSNLSSSESQFVVIQIAGVVLAYCQLLSHPLCFGLYNKEIREKLSASYPKQSQVIVLNTMA